MWFGSGRIVINLDRGRRSIGKLGDDCSSLSALRDRPRRRHAPIVLDAHHRNQRRARRHRQGLVPRANQDAIATKIQRPRKICDGRFVRVDKAEILATLPRPQNDMRQAAHPIGAGRETHRCGGVRRARNQRGEHDRYLSRAIKIRLAKQVVVFACHRVIDYPSRQS